MTVRRSPRGTAATVRTSHRRSLGRVSQPERSRWRWSFTIPTRPPAISPTGSPGTSTLSPVTWRRAPRPPARVSTGAARSGTWVPARRPGTVRIATSTRSTRSTPRSNWTRPRTGEQLKQALEGHVLADARLVGVYERYGATRPLYLGAAAKSPRLMGEAARGRDLMAKPPTATSRRAGSASRPVPPIPSMARFIGSLISRIQPFSPPVDADLRGGLDMARRRSAAAIPGAGTRA